MASYTRIAIYLTPYLRMKITTYLILGLSSLLFLSSCKSSDDTTCCDTPYVSGYYIQGYFTDLKEDGIMFEPNWALLSLDETNKIFEIDWNHLENQRGNALAMTLSFKAIHQAPTKGNSGGTPGYYNLFHVFSDSIGDNHYASSYFRSWTSEYPMAIGEKFESVKLFTDQDYAPEFKAGSDVSSLFTVYFEDMLRTVQNDYRSVTEEGTYQDKNFIINGDRNLFPHTISAVKLADIDFSKRQFTGTKWYLKPHQAPAESGGYTFTIEIKKENGQTVRKQTPAFYL